MADTSCRIDQFAAKERQKQIVHFVKMDSSQFPASKKLARFFLDINSLRTPTFTIDVVHTSIYAIIKNSILLCLTEQLCPEQLGLTSRA